MLLLILSVIFMEIAFSTLCTFWLVVSLVTGGVGLTLLAWVVDKKYGNVRKL